MKSLEILAGECEELSATLTAAVERGEALPEPELHALLGRARCCTLQCEPRWLPLRRTFFTAMFSTLGQSRRKGAKLRRKRQTAREAPRAVFHG
jgi:hypothetical protein